MGYWIVHFEKSTKLRDASGNPINSLEGAIDIHDADVHREAVNHYLYRELANYTLAADVSSQATQITLTSVTGVVIGSDFHMRDTATGNHDHTFVTVTNIVGNVVTLNRPLDNSYLAASTIVTRISRNMNVVGSLGTPIIYLLKPTEGQAWHINSISFSMTDTTAMDDATFGGRTALPNGVSVRLHDITNGTYNTYSFWRKNSDFYLDCFTPSYADKAPSGYYGFRGKLFIKDSYGAVVYLANTVSSEIQLEVLIQDDLSVLDTFEITVHAHIAS